MDYQIRVSTRAKRVRLTITRQGLEVVIPRNFNPEHVPAIVHDHRAWIDKHLRQALSRPAAPPPDRAPPQRVTLAAVGAQWTFQYHDHPETDTYLREYPDRQVMVWGDISDQEVCNELARRWLLGTAKRILAPWLKRLSIETGLSYQRLTVRTQKSRWGSCSTSGTISLNAKLMFVEPQLVRHVLVHELCHTVHPNHSKDFWALVEHHDPDYRQLKERLHEGWLAVPGWLGDR